MDIKQEDIITELTEAQRNQLAIYRDKWLEIGLRTGPANRARAEKLIHQLYEVNGFAPPKKITWFDGPKTALDYVNEKGLTDSRCYGYHDAAWLGYYDYFAEVFSENKTVQQIVAPLKPLIELAKEVGWFWPYDEECIISERMARISLTPGPDGIKVLHDTVGPAVVFADGAKEYFLNGVAIMKDGKFKPEWVETPANELDPRCILEADNVEVRRELIKKLGLERVYDVLKDKTIDTSGDYELVDLKITDRATGRYLKMRNPSIDAVHLEGVPNEVKTVAEALAWRDEDEGAYDQPIQLT